MTNWRSVNVLVMVWLLPTGVKEHGELVETQAPAKLVSCEPTAGVAVSVTSLPSKDVKVVPDTSGRSSPPPATARR